MTETARLRPAQIASMLGVSMRMVQQMAQTGALPALKLGRVWTFDPNQVKAWIKQEELRQWRARQRLPTSTAEASSGGDVLRLPDASIDEAFARLIPRKRGIGSRAGARD